jgi:hypothetical protein
MTKLTPTKNLNACRLEREAVDVDLGLRVPRGSSAGHGYAETREAAKSWRRE